MKLYPPPLPYEIFRRPKSLYCRMEFQQANHSVGYLYTLQHYAKHDLKVWQVPHTCFPIHYYNDIEERFTMILESKEARSQTEIAIDFIGFVLTWCCSTKTCTHFTIFRPLRRTPCKCVHVMVYRICLGKCTTHSIWLENGVTEKLQIFLSVFCYL